MKARTLLFIVMLWSVCGCSGKPPTGPEISVSESPTQEIRERIEVGFGPSNHWEVLLLKSYPEPLWLLGAEISVVDNEGKSADLDLVDLVNVAWTYPAEHNHYFFPDQEQAAQIFRLTKSLPKVMFPEGYAVPLWSNEPLAASVRWRNRSLYQKNTEVKLVLTLHFVRKRSAKKDYTALAVGELFAAAPLDSDAHFGLVESAPSPALRTPRGKKRKDDVGILIDAYQHQFSEEWSVSQGTSVSEFLVGPQVDKLPPGEAVMTTAYVYPSITEVELVSGSARVILEEPFISAEAIDPHDQDASLRISQEVRKESARALTYLLSYFPVRSFKDFPELRQ